MAPTKSGKKKKEKVVSRVLQSDGGEKKNLSSVGQKEERDPAKRRTSMILRVAVKGDRSI